MKMPTTEQLDTAIAWLRSNEGEEGGEKERCAAVADWIEHEEREREIRAAARKAGVTPATFRRRLNEMA